MGSYYSCSVSVLIYTHTHTHVPTHTDALPQLSNMERIQVLQERLRGVQRKWGELKTEVAYLDRKRRRARRKEREGEILLSVCLMVCRSEGVKPRVAVTVTSTLLAHCPLMSVWAGWEWPNECVGRVRVA